MGQQTGTPGGQPPAGKKKSPLPWAAGAVGLALVVAVGAYAINQRDDKVTGTPPSTSVTQPSTVPTSASNPASSSGPASSQPVSSSAPPSSAATSTVKDTEKAPGPGTLQSVMTELDKHGFTCTDETGQDFTSRLCTQFEKSPSMFVYVAAHRDGSLGRLSLSVESSSKPATSKALSDFLIAQFAAPGDVARVKTAIAASTGSKYVESGTDTIEFRGLKNGSVVMYAPDFAANAEPARLAISGEKVQAALKAKGYACRKESSRVTDCKKTAGGVLAEARFADDDGIAFINVTAEGTAAAAVKSTLTAEMKNVFGPLPGGLAAKTQKTVASANQTSGSITFVDGFLHDYYPVAAQSGKQRGGFYVRSSCWQDLNTNC